MSDSNLSTKFGKEINMKFFKDILICEGKSIYSDYYLTSSLDYEAARCNLYGKSFMYYIIKAIKEFLKKLGNMVIMSAPLIFQWVVFIIAFSWIFLPILVMVWSAISQFMCFLINDFGLKEV